MLNLAHLEKTKERYRARTLEREGTTAKLATGAFLKADTPERVHTRLVRKGVDPTVAEELVRGEISLAEAESASPRMRKFVERIMGKDNLIGASFLTAGARACRAVCRVEMCEASGLVTGYGTGVMVSRRLLLTNNHVLATAASAAASVAEFGFEEDGDGKIPPTARFALEPDSLFVTDPELDYTVVAVSPSASAGQALEDFGWVPLIASTGKVIKGEYLNIIQHPNGEPKRVALRENQLVDLLDDFLHYKTDTAQGSSGSPVFNDEWEMVALHHSGVADEDDAGNTLTIDGRVWTPEMGEHVINWIANEGARVSRILAHLGTQNVTDVQRPFLEEALSGDSNGEPALPPPRAEPGQGSTLQRLASTPANGHAAATEATAPVPTTASDMVVTWTIPIQVTARLGTPLGGSPLPQAGPSLPSVLPAPPTPISVSGNDREWATIAGGRRGQS